ncbi:MAG: hypothetical protein ABJF89_06225 [Parasphingorhabdus sp.]|uniref:hypothetical protein n=1 Tax=Parasphingorhabdus sp. TaxID=2709688 RepID=UPI00326758C8
MTDQDGELIRFLIECEKMLADILEEDPFEIIEKESHKTKAGAFSGNISYYMLTQDKKIGPFHLRCEKEMGQDITLNLS